MNNGVACVAALGPMFVAAPVYPATQHVSTSGDEAGDGTNERPFRTIQRAADRAASGDTGGVMRPLRRLGRASFSLPRRSDFFHQQPLILEPLGCFPSVHFSTEAFVRRTHHTAD